MRKRLTATGEDGFMLVEILVGISLLAVVIGLASDSIISGLRGQREVQSRASDLDGLRQAMERTTQAIRPATTILGATATTLAVSETAQSGGTRTLTWSVSGTSLVQDETATAVSGTTTPIPRVTILSNLDPAGNVFSYVPRGSYTPATANTVNTSTCQIIAAPTSYAPECIGTVTVQLRALLVGHPDLTLVDTVDLRNQQ